MKSITVLGELTDAEFSEIVALVRAIDERHPTRTIVVIAEDSGKTLDEAEQAVVDALPPNAHRVTVIRSEASRS